MNRWIAVGHTVSPKLLLLFNNESMNRRWSYGVSKKLLLLLTVSPKTAAFQQWIDESPLVIRCLQKTAVTFNGVSKTTATFNGVSKNCCFSTVNQWIDEPPLALWPHIPYGLRPRGPCVPYAAWALCWTPWRHVFHNLFQSYLFCSWRQTKANKTM